MKTTKKVLAVVFAIILCIGITACKQEQSAESLWDNALYTEDTELGSGKTTLTVAVKAEDKTINLHIKTDKKTVGEALVEHKLVEGEEGAYGLYIKSVNGIVADFDVDKSYWAFYVDGEYATSGVDTTEISAGVKYSLEYTKD